MEAKKSPKTFLVANNIRSAYNVGALFRIASSLGASLILQGITPHPKVSNDTRLPYVIEKAEKELAKTSLNTISLVPFYYFKREEEVIQFLKRQTVSIYVLENNLKKAVNLFDLKKQDLTVNYALVLGHETEGVNELFIKEADKIIFIPSFGDKSSLNVSVTAGIAGYCLKKLSM